MTVRAEAIPAMTRAWLRSHPVLAYYALVFAISWGGILCVAGPSGIFNSQANPEELTQFIYVAALAGPSLAGILMTGLMHGRVGLRDLVLRVFRWRVGVRWWSTALLTAPILMVAILFVLSLTSPGFVPAIVTTDDRVGLMVSGIILGLVVSFFEELGWTGFATPELRRRHGIVATGLMMGLVWGAWHYPLFSGSASGAIPPVLYIGVLLFSFLIPFRILMVWVHDRTRSVLVVMLMHAPLAAGQLILLPSAISNESAVIFDLVFAAALWILVAAVWMIERRERPSSGPLPSRRITDDGSLAVKAVRGLHTVIYGVLALSTLIVLAVGITGRFMGALWIVLPLMAVEVVVLSLNRARCPLTGVVDRLSGAPGSVPDTYLPEPLTRRTLAIYGPLLAVGAMLIAGRAAGWIGVAL